MKRLLLPACALVLVLSACGAVETVSVHDTHGLASRREVQAAREASVLLHNLRPPPGATRTGVPKEYGGVLRNIPTPFGEFVRRTRYWRVPAERAAVVSFLQAHGVPRGFTAHCGSNPHSGSSQCEVYAGRHATRQLEFSVQRTRKRGSILRVDTQVVWVYPRSPKERVRASRVREIDFSTPKVSKRVTDPAMIARIVRWFNAAPILPPGIGSPMCGVYATVPVTLDFRGAGRHRLAHVSVDAAEPSGVAGVCNPMSVTIAGISQQPLISGHFFGRVQREIGVTVN